MYNILQDPHQRLPMRDLRLSFTQQILFDIDSVNVIKSEWCFCAFTFSLFVDIFCDLM